jgi:hypothetical protein
VEKRENEESPINWGHSYCNKLSLFRGAAEVEGITTFPALVSIKMKALQLAKNIIANRKAITNLDFGIFYFLSIKINKNVSSPKSKICCFSPHN